MARFHRVGFDYPHPVQGNEETWADKWEHRHELWHELKDSLSISQELLSEGMQVIEKTEVCTLTRTILHGDFRFCHVFFEDSILSGLVDVDESSQGERLIDLCYGLASGSSPAGGSLLTFEQLKYTLSIYDRCLPLNRVERSLLKGVLAWALLETLCDLSEFQATERDIKQTQTLLSSVLFSDKLLESSS